jgi:hypothetical protein
VWEDWQFHSYMGRNHQIDLVMQPATLPGALYMTDKDCAAPTTQDVTEIDLGLSVHRLFVLGARD